LNEQKNASKNYQCTTDSIRCISLGRSFGSRLDLCLQIDLTIARGEFGKKKRIGVFRHLASEITFDKHLTDAGHGL
jgi:hypothetical protein